MTSNDINDMMLYGERINIEYKEATNELPKSVWETYSSFANTIGGTIILGIKERRNHTIEQGRFEVTGVNDTDKILKSFWDTINSDKVSRNILMEDNVECIDYNGKNIIAIHVPMANYTMRPIYINKNLIGGSYKRNFEGDYHCTDEEVKSMLRDANENGNDGTLVENYDLNDIDMPTLHAYRNRFEVRNVDHAFNQLDDKEFLRNMGGYVFDRNTHREGLTVAGLMMFGKGLPVRDRFDNIRMDYIDKTNLETDSRWSDRLTYDGTWENNLFNFFMRVIAKLTQDLKRPFKLEGMERIDDTPIHKAVREALTNMIIHADLLITGVLKIEKYEKEFLFSNPGSLKLPMEDIMHGGNSKARNPRIQNMLRMIGYGENIGSGYPTILKTWKEQNWRKPILIDRTELRQVDLTLPMVSLLPASTLAEMKAYYGEETYNSFTANEQQVMAYVWNGDSVSNMELQQMLGMNSLEIGKLLHNMVDKNLLNQESKNRWTTYNINKEITPENGCEVKSEVKSEECEVKNEECEVKNEECEVKNGKSEVKNEECEVKNGKSEVKNEECEVKSGKRTLANSENDVLNLIKQNAHITYAEIGETLALGETSVYKILKHLRQKNLIHRKGGRVFGYWVVNNSESFEK